MVLSEPTTQAKSFIRKFASHTKAGLLAGVSFEVLIAMRRSDSSNVPAGGLG